MLVLSRKVGEKIVLPNCGVTIGVVGINGKKVRIGITAPPKMSIHRKEVWHRICESRDLEHDCCLVQHDPTPVLTSDTDSMVQQLSNDTGNPKAEPTATINGMDWQQKLKRKIAVRTYGHLLGLDVEIIDGRLIVHGRSRSYYGKQLACAAALEILKTPNPAPFDQVELDIKVLRSH